jgi:nucleoredoxin
MNKTIPSNLLFILFISFNLGSRLSAEIHPEMSNLIPDSLIDSNENKVARDQLDGKIVGLYFSAGWCPPCRSFSPTLKEFRDKHEVDFEVIMVSADNSKSEQLKYMQDGKMKWPAFPTNSIESSNLYNKFGVRSIPTLIILAPNGEIISSNGRTDVSQNSSNAMATWKQSNAYKEFEKLTVVDSKDEKKDGITATPPKLSPPSRPLSELEKEINLLKEENKRKDELIVEISKRADECQKNALESNATCVAVSDELLKVKKELAGVVDENRLLQNELTSALQKGDECDMEILELRKQLEECFVLASTPFLNGWVFAKDHGWLFTDAQTFPFVYLESTSSWYFYEIGSSEPRRFFNYKSEKWENWD